MSSVNDSNAMEVLDEIENLVFLCDRLHTRLMQVTTYVDEIKHTWVSKRHAIECETNTSSIIAQKAAKCNKVLLNVAEKLACVELQTESLQNLHTPTANKVFVGIEKSHGRLSLGNDRDTFSRVYPRLSTHADEQPCTSSIDDQE